MELRGALAGLRRDDLEWRRGQLAMAKALSAWRREPAAAPVLAAMKRFGAGAALASCGPLAELFTQGTARAPEFADSLVVAALAALDGNPLGQLPLPHGASDAVPTLVLARDDDATLAIVAYDGAVLAMLPPPGTARFRPVESWNCVLRGCGAADVVRWREGCLPEIQRIALGQGQVHYRRGDATAVEVRRADGALVVLRLERALRDAEPVREVRLADGALLHRASARRADSRDELIVSLLGRMERMDAIPGLAALALGEGGEALRWRALCEVIVLDAVAGVELLQQVAADGQDPLAAQAAQLCETLFASRPELREAAV